ncbi:unnamed protein product, partial [Hapterophycus canaliculatus]
CRASSLNTFQVGTANDPNLNNLADEGETIIYDVAITNNGNVRISDI